MGIFSWYQNALFEICLRVVLFFVYLICELIPPFVRAIQPEELWLYNYPHSDSYISMTTLWILALTIPLITILVFYMKTKNVTDVNEALWCLTLIISLNGAVTNAIKVMVGRPRPDYVHRCFPNGNYQTDIPCIGSHQLVNDGRKSFPSGHSSVAFSSFGFLSLYLAAKLKTFTVNKKGSGPRLLIVFCPLFFALCVAISRTCDYHHHWQDVTVGSFLGMTVCIICYFHFYPSLTSDKCDIPWKQLNESQEEHIARVKEI